MEIDVTHTHVTPTNECGQISVTQAQGQALRDILTQGSKFHTHSKKGFVRRPCHEKVGLGFSRIK